MHSWTGVASQDTLQPTEAPSLTAQPRDALGAYVINVSNTMYGLELLLLSVASLFIKVMEAHPFLSD